MLPNSWIVAHANCGIFPRCPPEFAWSYHNINRYIRQLICLKQAKGRRAQLRSQTILQNEHEPGGHVDRKVRINNKLKPKIFINKKRVLWKAALFFCVCEFTKCVSRGVAKIILHLFGAESKFHQTVAERLRDWSIDMSGTDSVSHVRRSMSFLMCQFWYVPFVIVLWHMYAGMMDKKGSRQIWLKSALLDWQTNFVRTALLSSSIMNRQVLWKLFKKIRFYDIARNFFYHPAQLNNLYTLR